MSWIIEAGASLQKARSDVVWIAAQEAKMQTFVYDDVAKVLTLANLSKPQADFAAAVSCHYGLVARPMPLLAGKHRLQLMKGPNAAVPEPQLTAYSRTLTNDDLAQLQEPEEDSEHVLQCVPAVLRLVDRNLPLVMSLHSVAGRPRALTVVHRLIHGGALQPGAP